MPKLRSIALGMCMLLAAPTLLASQKVAIRGATRADVVREVTNQIGEQGFRLEDSTKREARWGLDRGLISQTGAGNVITSVPVVLELHLRFKDKPEGMEVTADEEVVGNRGNRMEFRKPVRSAQEHDTMQQLLDLVKTNLEARTAP